MSVCMDEKGHTSACGGKSVYGRDGTCRQRVQHVFKSVYMGDELAKEKGISNGDRVKVSSKRGHIEAVAVVTKRLRALDCGGTRVHQIGLPNHWGFMGLARKGFSVNTLSPSVGDANTQTPEYKAFTVNIEKA